MMDRPTMLEALNSAAFEMQRMDAEIKNRDAQIERLVETAEQWRTIALAPENQPQAFRKQLLKELHKELGTMKWMGADEGWDKAIEAVRMHLSALAQSEQEKSC